MAWEPMSREEAEAILAALPMSGQTDAAGASRLVEAMLVSEGADRERIKRAVERIRGHQLESAPPRETRRFRTTKPVAGLEPGGRDWDALGIWITPGKDGYHLVVEVARGEEMEQAADKANESGVLPRDTELGPNDFRHIDAPPEPDA